MTTPNTHATLTNAQKAELARDEVTRQLEAHGLRVEPSTDSDSDLTIAGESGQYRVKVRSASAATGYAFWKKRSFALSPCLFGAVVLTGSQPPQVFLIPSMAWLRPDSLLKSRDFPGLQSAPEWGVELSLVQRPNLEDYALSIVAPLLV